MGYAVDMANEFKKRNNSKRIGAITGTVLSVNPLKIGILDNEVILDSTNSYICSYLLEKYSRKATMKIQQYTSSVSATDSGGYSISSITVNEKDDYDTEITYNEILKKDDEVLVIANESGQAFFIVDKIIKIE